MDEIITEEALLEQRTRGGIAKIYSEIEQAKIDEREANIKKEWISEAQSLWKIQSERARFMKLYFFIPLVILTYWFMDPFGESIIDSPYRYFYTNNFFGVDTQNIYFFKIQAVLISVLSALIISGAIWFFYSEPEYIRRYETGHKSKENDIEVCYAVFGFYPKIAPLRLFITVFLIVLLYPASQFYINFANLTPELYNLAYICINFYVIFSSFFLFVFFNFFVLED